MTKRIYQLIHCFEFFIWVIVSDFVLRISNFMIQKNGFRSGAIYPSAQIGFAGFFLA